MAITQLDLFYSTESTRHPAVVNLASNYFFLFIQLITYKLFYKGKLRERYAGVKQGDPCHYSERLYTARTQPRNHHVHLRLIISKNNLKLVVGTEIFCAIDEKFIQIVT